MLEALHGRRVSERTWSAEGAYVVVGKFARYPGDAAFALSLICAGARIDSRNPGLIACRY